jgi:two-component system sensor histidine kinase LytS
VKLENNQVHVKVKDNGKGIEKERLAKLGHSTVVSEKGTGTALHNINQRLIGLFGKDTTIHISSVLDQATEVFFTIPIQRENEGELDVTRINS